MQYRYIGKSGLRVSPICLGTMTFGDQSSEDESFKIMDRAYDTGVNFFDTAEVYPVPPRVETGGRTEEIIGSWLKSKPRDSLIIASKVAGAASGWFVPPTRHGLTAIDSFHINKAIDGTLKRLGTDYIDLYQVHWPDTIVEVEESLEALDLLVKSGKVRYIGISNERSYGLTKALYTSKNRGFIKYQSVQNNFSLLNRRDLDEVAEVCRQEQVSLLPYSPLAGGVLSGKYNSKIYPENARFTQYLHSDNPRIVTSAKRFLNEQTLKSTEKYMQIAKEANISVTTLAVAWSKQFDFVASTIIGARNVNQLDDSLKAMDVTLSKEILKACDAVHDEIKYPMG